MKKNLINKGLASLIVLLLGGISIISSAEINEYKSIIDERSKQISCLNMFESTTYYCDVSTGKLYKGNNQGIIFLGYAPGTNFLSGGTWIPDNEYPWWVAEKWLNNSGSSIWRINSNGDYEQVIYNCGAALNGLEFDPVTEQLFGCDDDTLYNINISTGEATIVGYLTTNPPPLFITMGINNEGQGYGINIVDDSLYRINLSDASIELIGGTGQSMTYAQDCSFDHDADPEVLYHAGYTYSPNLFIVNTETGYCYYQGPLLFETTAFAISYGGDNQDPYADFTWTPLGPNINETVYFDASDCYDPDGYILKYCWNWDDGHSECTTSLFISHNWSNAGDFKVKLTVLDNIDGYSTKSYTITIFGNNPPLKPEIKGPAKGKIGKEYIYYISTITDPDEDSINVFWDWGDGTNTGWLGAYPSGQEICESHSWKSKDTYIIKAKLKDEHGAESEWGTFEVKIPKNRAISCNNWLSFLERLPIIEEVYSRLIKD